LPPPSLDCCTLPRVAHELVILSRISGRKTDLLVHAQTLRNHNLRRDIPYHFQHLYCDELLITYHALWRQKRSYPNWLSNKAVGAPAPTIDAQKKQCYHTPQLPRPQSARRLVLHLSQSCSKMLSRNPRLLHERLIVQNPEVQDRILPPNEPQYGQCCAKLSSKTTPQSIHQ